jgi:cell division protein ZapA
MAQVAVTINGKSYPVTCDDGQEERIRRLAQYIDGKVAGFVKSLGQVGEARLLLLAALVLADELAEANDTVLRARRGTAAAAGNGQAGRHDSATEAVLATGIESLAARIEAIAVRLENTHL